MIVLLHNLEGKQWRI